MAGRKPGNDVPVVERRSRIAALYLQGQSQYAIGKAVDLSQPQVSRELKALRRQWLESSTRDYGERVAEELARIDHLEAEAWAAWVRSQQPAESTTAEKADGGGPSRSKASKRLVQRDGNPAYLATVERCIARRCELLGLDAPKKVAPPEDEYTLLLATLLADDATRALLSGCPQALDARTVADQPGDAGQAGPPTPLADAPAHPAPERPTPLGGGRPDEAAGGEPAPAAR